MNNPATNPQQPAPTSSPPSIVAVIPTYNNALTIATVIKDVQAYISNIIVVIDGSTDETAPILNAIAGIRVISFVNNRGKGAALRAGFEAALKQGFTHALSFDADGQHLGLDIPAFITATEQTPQALIIGNRTMPMGDTLQPARSKYGGKWGALWYRFHTGLTIDDTQCGMRIYPLAATLALGSTANRYDYEQELLIQAVWKGTPVRQIPIHRLYLPPEQRVSHFRPIRDFARLFLVNSKAALIRIFMPWRFIDAPGSSVKEKLYHLIMKEIRGGYGPVVSAISLSVGVLFGLLPIPLFQVISVLILSYMFRLSKLLAMLGVSISSAPFLPFWIALGVAIGKVMLPDKTIIAALTPFLSWIASASPRAAFAIGSVQWFFGSIVMAIAFSIATLAITLPLFAGFTRLRKHLKSTDVNHHA